MERALVYDTIFRFAEPLNNKIGCVCMMCLKRGEREGEAKTDIEDVVYVEIVIIPGVLLCYIASANL